MSVFLQVLSVVHAVIEASLGHQAQVSSIIRDDILRAAKVPAAAASNVARGAAAVTQALAGERQQRGCWAVAFAGAMN
jgi:predicted nucleic acid-binding Zn ribbon protein